MTFTELLNKKWGERKFVCVNLDPVFEKLPESVKGVLSIEEALFRFNKEIIDATHDLVCAYKPNSAFYEAYGEEGLRALKRTASYIHGTYRDIPTILDAKRADIGHTNEMYAASAFDEFGFGALTVNPYLGGESLAPFLKRKDKGVFVLAKTSNPGSSEFQDMNVNGEKLYERVARNVAEKWNTNGNCGVVAGATYLEELSRVRRIIGDMPILVPGVGAQGGSAKDAFAAGKNKNETGIIIAVGRSVLYATHGEDFATAARRETENIVKEIGRA